MENNWFLGNAMKSKKDQVCGLNKTTCITGDQNPSLPINNLENTLHKMEIWKVIGYLSNNLFDINCTGYFDTLGNHLLEDEILAVRLGGK